jgi:Bax protein
MKKKLTYRDKLVELAYIYDVREIKEYEKSRKNLTTGQLELILRKNKITIPKDYKSNFFRDTFIKPATKAKSNLVEFKDNQIKAKNKLVRKVENLKHDTKRNINRSLQGLWAGLGNIGLNFLNIIPKLGKVVYVFFGDLFTDIFNAIYNQQLDPKKAKHVIIGFFVIVFSTSIIISGLNYFSGEKLEVKKLEVKKEVKKPEVKKEVKKPEVKKKVKKPEVKKEVKKLKVKKDPNKTELKVKRKDVNEVVLPNLNLKTETVLNLFKDVDYTLSGVRADKLVKPIYFTQFPKDLETIQSNKLKKETFIQIVLPLVVAENERILEDREKLKVLSVKKFTTDLEKQWMRQKLLEYKVKKGDLNELMYRMDIIPTSIALAQAAKESGWGTSRFALEGNAIFGQWTWSGKGIAPLDRESNKNHKILKFPILRASVKAYQNNLNTHKSYKSFRDKRLKLREKSNKLNGLELTETLKNYAQTGSEYTKILNQIIKQNRLTDFEPVRLVGSVKQIELSS